MPSANFADAKSLAERGIPRTDKSTRFTIPSATHKKLTIARIEYFFEKYRASDRVKSIIIELYAIIIGCWKVCVIVDKSDFLDRVSINKVNTIDNIMVRTTGFLSKNLKNFFIYVFLSAKNLNYFNNKSIIL